MNEVMNIVVLHRGQSVQHRRYKWAGTVQSFGDGWVRVKRADTGEVRTVLPHKLVRRVAA